MPLVNLVLKHIRVDNAGESEAEWDLTISAAAAAQREVSAVGIA
jgi:hypothetical protein